MDEQGPTAERLRHAGEFHVTTGRARSQKRTTMVDDALGKALHKQIIAPDEYSALSKYALHWLAGGLAGHVSSVDLNRVLATSSSLASSERSLYHRQLYHQAHDHLGKRPAFVADLVACYDYPIGKVGLLLGYQSLYRGREKAIEILRDAGYRLVKFWDDLARCR